jgi:hypothetical protein
VDRGSIRTTVTTVYRFYFPVIPKESVLLTQYFASDKIKKNEMGGACSAYGGGERCVQGFGGET